MKQFFCSLFLLCFIQFALPQKLVWKAGIHSFFDNSEFGHSKVQTPQTMSGVHFAPEAGMSWNGRHRAYAGIDAMHEFGSDKAVDYFDPIIYYEFDGNPFRFYMGAFPRKNVLDKYPRMFFQDSISYYRPVINGLFWEYRSEGNFFNLWIDWASRQTYERNEAFFMGWSGRYNYGALYVQHFGYMFHFAANKDTANFKGVHDNGLMLTSLGVDFASVTGFEKLEANAGWSVGTERYRTVGEWHFPSGFLSEIKVEFRGVGVFNTYYKGGRQQVFYSEYGNRLYWGDPVFRSGEYNRTDLYINFFKTDVVHVKLCYSLHFTEKQMYQQQSLYAVFDLGNMEKKNRQPYRYLWDNWFKSN
jgi:hypothetical protein